MFERFKHRSYELERLDTGDYTQAEYRRWEREMYFIHRIFGEFRALRGSLYKDLMADGGESVSVLDVGAGSGELLKQLAKWIPGRRALLVGVEINPEATRTISANGITAVQGDALRLPFSDCSFDYSFCSLFLHHLGDNEALQLLCEMRRVARKRIYVIDLNRHPAAYYFYKVVGGLFLQRFTIEDGSLSILRSFDPDELIALAARAGLHDVKVERSKANRLVLSGI